MLRLARSVDGSSWSEILRKNKDGLVAFVSRATHLERMFEVLKKFGRERKARQGNLLTIAAQPELSIAFRACVLHMFA